MYIQYCLVAIVTILVISLIVYYFMKKNNQASNKNVVILALCVGITVVTAILTPPVAKLFVLGLSFPMLGAVSLTVIIFIISIYILFCVFEPKITSLYEGKKETEASETINEEALSTQVGLESKEEALQVVPVEKGSQEEVSFDYLYDEELLQIDAQDNQEALELVNNDNEAHLQIEDQDDIIDLDHLDNIEELDNLEIEDPEDLEGQEALETAYADQVVLQTEDQDDLEDLDDLDDLDHLVDLEDLYDIEELDHLEIEDPDDLEGQEALEAAYADQVVLQTENQDDLEVLDDLDDLEDLEDLDVLEDLGNLEELDNLEVAYQDDELMALETLDLVVEKTVTQPIEMGKEYSDDKGEDILKIIDKAMTEKDNSNYENAIKSYEAALVLKPEKELCYLIILDLCSLYKKTHQKELVYKLLDSSPCELLNSDKKGEIIRNINI